MLAVNLQSSKGVVRRRPTNALPRTLLKSMVHLPKEEYYGLNISTQK